MTQDNFNNILGFFQRHNLLPPQPKLVDVGACKGWFTIDFLRYFPDAIVTGIDLDHRAEAYYRRITASPSPQFIHSGVADYEGEADIFLIPQANDITELGTLVNRNAEFPGLQWRPGGRVYVHRLDTLIQQADFVKIDAELMDLKILAGMTGLLTSERPPVGIVFELVSQTLGYTGYEAVNALLEPYGYMLLLDHKEDLWPSAEFGKLLGLNTTAILKSAYATVKRGPIEPDFSDTIFEAWEMEDATNSVFLD